MYPGHGAPPAKRSPAPWNGWCDGAVTPSLPRPHPHDVGIAAAGLLSGLLLWSLGLRNGMILHGLPYWFALPPLVVMAAAEVLRRCAPRTALLLGVVAITGDQLVGSLIATIIMFTDVVYATVLYGSPAWARGVPRVTLVITVVATAVPPAVFRSADALLIGVVFGLVTLAPAWTGWLIRGHRDTAATERLRAEQTALLAEMDRRAAIVQERARMARELHDMVANHLSAIAIHSTAALSVSARDPEATGRALTVIRENSVQGLAEMRRLIGLLRTAAERGGEPAEVPRLDALDALLDRARDAGGTARTGAGAGLSFELSDVRPEGAALPAPLELAGYRIVQESVTNALKHASPGTVTVRVEQSSRALVITVDSPYSGGPGPRAPGAGAGLVGMEERAALLNGTFEAGPVAGGRAGGPGGGSAGGAGPRPAPGATADDRASPGGPARAPAPAGGRARDRASAGDLDHARAGTGERTGDPARSRPRAGTGPQSGAAGVWRVRAELPLGEEGTPAP